MGKAKKIQQLLFFVILSGLFLSHCKPNYEKGEYGYDLEFLRNKVVVVELMSGDSRLVLVPEYQGRVMSSSSAGMKGYSHGWINYEWITSPDVQQDNNVFGGEERIWLGPEAGGFSLFFEESDTAFRSWIVPDALDSEAFEVTYSDSSTVVVEKSIELKNYSGTTFHAKINRKVTLLDKNTVNNLLGIELGKSIQVVGYQSENKLINTGNTSWNKQSGALSIWMLSMLKASPSTTVVLPYKEEGEGKVVYNYFRDIPKDRLKISDDAVFFLADAKFRSKIGISPSRVLPYMGSYDSQNKVLTIVKFTLPENESDYVNSRFDPKEDPFKGDVVNFFNNGSDRDGLQFYELESSSPAALLEPGGQITHTQWIYHFTGDKKHLDKITTSLLNTKIEEITQAFKSD